MSIKELLEREGQWNTQIGKAYPGERVVFRGFDLHHDLANESWLAIYLLGITGRKFEGAALKVLNYMWVSTSYPDVRIWNNRVAALAGSAKSHAAGAMGAAIAVSDAQIYGGQAFIQGVEFFQHLQTHLQKGVALESLIEHKLKQDKPIFGFGRAMQKTDERVPHMLEFLRKEELDLLPSVQLARRMEKILHKEKGLFMNISALYCAIANDLGFSPREFHCFMTLAFSAGMLPCYLETLNSSPGTFFPLSCRNINYQGKPRRKYQPNRQSVPKKNTTKKSSIKVKTTNRSRINNPA